MDPDHRVITRRDSTAISRIQVYVRLTHFNAVIPVNCVWVRQTDLSALQRQTRTLQQTLHKALGSDLRQVCVLLDKVEHELEVAQQEVERATNEREHWQARCETALADARKEKEEKFQLQCDLQEMSRQLSQQSAYCASMGAATCTLLWRLSRCEDSIESIIVGWSIKGLTRQHRVYDSWGMCSGVSRVSQDSIESIIVGCKVDEFLGVTSSTVESYVDTYKEDVPQDQTDETVFILALCGIITNIAASPCGRDFLMTRDTGRTLLDTFVTVLSEAPSRKCARMKK
ncbi:Heat shock factor 2-binding protein [Lamellibrachia satsuma]|nr:Heat shock factor 2-binding protein [Lamellibrachia satsuma]